MTFEQQAFLAAARLHLFLCAIKYARENRPGHEARVEHDLLMAAKNFAHTVDAIDPKLWETASEPPRP